MIIIKIKLIINKKMDNIIEGKLITKEKRHELFGKMNGGKQTLKIIKKIK